MAANRGGSWLSLHRPNVTVAQSPSAAQPAPVHKWRVLTAVIFGLFMVILDTTVVNVAFQALRTEFGASLDDSQWIISIYVLSLGISTPLAGFLAERLGIKRVYLGGLGIFALGSIACGLAPSLPFLVVARAVQGFGGGIALPLGTALLLQTFPVAEQGTALGIFGVAALSAPAIGPILGGYLVDLGLWRAIFFINPPIGLLGIVLGTFWLPRGRQRPRSPLDAYGLVTEVIGFGAVLYAASVAGNQGWNSPTVIRWFIVGAFGLAIFGAIELLVAKEPLLNLRLFRRRTFLYANLLGYVSMVALFGAEFLLPIYLQSLRGLDAFQTGLLLLPVGLTGGVATVIAGRLYDRLGPRPLIVFGYLVLIVNTYQLSKLTANTSYGHIALLLALRGVALGATVQTTFVTALSVVPLAQIPRGSALINASRQVAQSIAVAVLATVLATSVSPTVAALQNTLLDLPPARGVTPIALCATPPAGAVAATAMAADPAQTPAAAGATVAPPVAVPPGLLQQACSESISGFERAYRITFYAAIVALGLGLILPGWPLPWAGRRSADDPPPAA